MSPATNSGRRRRLVVVPSDPIDAYVAKGREGLLQSYYNPGAHFDEVFVVSPLEKGQRQAYGMTILGVAETGFTRTLRRIRPDVVRAYGGYWPTDLACLRRIAGVPVVVSVHDGDPANLYPTIVLADRVLCVSPSVVDMALAKGVEPDRIRLLPNRVDVTRFRPVSDPARLTAVAGRFPPGRHILHIGRKSAEKNLETVIRALPLLPPDYMLVAVGQGDAGPFVRLAREQGVEPRCFWIDSIPNHELPLWYAWCACLCNPSLWEGFGIVFIEAAACGTPIVTSDLAPMNRYLADGESARLVKDYLDPAALAAGIRQACEAGPYRARLREGAVRAAAPFDQQVIDAQEVAFYREAMACRPPAARVARSLIWRARRVDVKTPVLSRLAAAEFAVRRAGHPLAVWWRARRGVERVARRLETCLDGARLVVIPSDPIEAYERAGYGSWLESYYNPQGCFASVHALSPAEHGERQAYGMTIRGVGENEFRSELLRLKPAVVRAYGGYWPADLAVRCRVSGIPVVVSVHDRRPEFIHRSVCLADRVICVSGAVAQAVRRCGVPEHRIRMLPNGINRRIFAPVTDKGRLAAIARRFPAGRAILHVGRRSPEKNLDTLIRSLAHLPAEYYVVSVGAGDRNPYLDLARDIAVDHRCFWVDRVENSELPTWYSWCYCMCTPSRAEGFGIVFIEAAACGAAIVTTDQAPMNEYLADGQSACLVKNPDEAVTLARAVRRACEDAVYRARIREGALAVSERFDRDRLAAMEVDLYREAVMGGAFPAGGMAT